MNTVDTALDKEDDLELILDGYHIIKLGNAKSSETDWYELKESIEAWATSLTNEAELRGRVDELESITGFSDVGGVYTKAGVDTTGSWSPVSIKERLAALLKLKGGEEKHD